MVDPFMVDPFIDPFMVHPFIDPFIDHLLNQISDSDAHYGE